jgi:NAD(P)-dependent dehydrogenase (short-subunit alcohol dehydrogenase family)
MLKAYGALTDRCNGSLLQYITSQADTKTLTGGVSYNCSKAALTMLTKNMACELGPAFRANAIRPTAMETDMLRTVAAKHPEMLAASAHLKDRAIMKDRVTVEDCAELVFFLSSSKSRKITGQAVAIDAGIGIN